MLSQVTATESLARKLEQHSAHCGVIGLGYVGLPLLTRLGRVGFTGVGIDVNAERVARLQAGESYIDDVPQSEVADLLAQDVSGGNA